MNRSELSPMHDGLRDALNAMRRSELVCAAHALTSLPPDVARSDAALILFRRLGRMTGQALATADGSSLSDFVDILLLITPDTRVPPAFGNALAAILRSIDSSQCGAGELATPLAAIMSLVEAKRIEGQLLDAILDMVLPQGPVAAAIMGHILAQWRAVGYDGLPEPQLDRLINLSKSRYDALLGEAY